jgi:hypothetical protein
MRTLLTTLFLLLISSFGFGQHLSFKINNPYPFTVCGYSVTGRVFVGTQDGADAEVVLVETVEVMPGQNGVIEVDIPEGKIFDHISFTAIAHGSNVEFKNLGSRFEVRNNSCLDDGTTATFWQPIDKFEYNIWEGLITDVKTETKVITIPGNQ